MSRATLEFNLSLSAEGFDGFTIPVRIDGRVDEDGFDWREEDVQIGHYGNELRDAILAHWDKEFNALVETVAEFYDFPDQIRMTEGDAKRDAREG